MPILSSIDIPDDAKHAITYGIATAITQDIPDLIREHNLPTTNGIPLARWNWVHKRVSENLGGRFQSKYVSRGGWKVLLLYEQILGFTFSIMSEANLLSKQKSLPKNIHYLEALVAKNPKTDAIVGQLRLPGIEINREVSIVEQLRDKLLSDFVGIIQNHITIIFDSSLNTVTSARAVLLTPQLDISYSEDWSHLIKEPYIIGKASILEEMKDENPESLVRLKSNKQEKQSNELVSMQEKQKASNN
ncbi:MAG: DUF5986 family protein [Firmicutes bacterium]|nr:DUF5986 family protein [Bacillota bacterium]